MKAIQAPVPASSYRLLRKRKYAKHKTKIPRYEV